jgi:Fur family ferric uptake transcriptional regulator
VTLAPEFLLQLGVNWPIVRAMAKQHSQGPDYEGGLRRAGVRITRPRRVILDILAEAEGHPDAMEIFQRANAVDKSISLSTVYRTMKLLETMGAIHRHAFEGGPARFEQASGSHHDHLIDLDTGDVIEFHSKRIEELQDEIARSLGYEIVHHRLELYGRKKRRR